MVATIATPTKNIVPVQIPAACKRFGNAAYRRPCPLCTASHTSQPAIAAGMQSRAPNPIKTYLITPQLVVQSVLRKARPKKRHGSIQKIAPPVDPFEGGELSPNTDTLKIVTPIISGNPTSAHEGRNRRGKFARSPPNVMPPANSGSMTAAPNPGSKEPGTNAAAATTAVSTHVTSSGTLPF